MAEPTLTVAVPTYRRNHHLAALLPLLLAQLDELPAASRADVLVVDNDAGAGARTVVQDLADGRVRYVVEPDPGIAAARDRTLAECRDRDLLVFIDDDERPTPGWLARLLETWRCTGAAAVAGPVRSDFAGQRLDPWIEAGGFFARRHRIGVPTGTVIPMAATNNLLLDLRAVRRHDLHFAVDVRLAAGEDNLFTGHLTRVGERVVWCADAWVEEVVPVDRATRRWVLERSLSSGNSLARVGLRMAPDARASTRRRASLTIAGLLRIAGGLARWLAGVVSGSLEHQARGARTATRGLGVLLGACGYEYQAYRRSPAAHASAVDPP